MHARRKVGVAHLLLEVAPVAMQLVFVGAKWISIRGVAAFIVDQLGSSNGGSSWQFGDVGTPLNLSVTHCSPRSPSTK